MMSRSFNSFDRYVAVCGLILMCGSAASAGVFHRKHKPLSQKDDALASVVSKQPDKELFDRAMIALKKGKYDIARLDLQTLLNTYPDSEYQMRAKLAIGDTWYKEGGAAALTQAEEEYKDFITFFPDKPEAAEAQMKVADIYYKQMEKPDRDPTNASRAEEEYRAMLLQYPDSSLVPQAKQRLREVQEVLGNHEFDIGSFYQTRLNYAAAIARLQSIVDTYPLYSQMDQTLLDVGDAYEAEARNVGNMRLSAAAKERLTKVYEERASHAYDRVILEYPMAPHADDARDRLEAMGAPVPSPTSQEVAESAAIEQSRAPVNLKYKAVLLITSRPSTVQAARVGEPTMADPKQITAPEVIKEAVSDVGWSLRPGDKPAPAIPGASNDVNTAGVLEAGAQPSQGNGAGVNLQPGASPADANAPLQLNNVSGDTSVGAAVVDNGADSNAQTAPGASAPQEPPRYPEAGQPGTQPSAGQAGAPVGQSAPAAQAAPANGAASWPSAKTDNGGLAPVAPKDNSPLPTVQKPSEAPDQVNDVQHSGGAVNTAEETTTANGKKKKNPKPKFHSGDESSSKHKKKKGLHKLF